MPALLELRRVSRHYREGGGTRAVLAGVDLRLAAFEVVALLGASGSGKSTLLHLIAGLDAPDAGTIELEGHALGALDERARTLVRRRRIGIVFQAFNLVPTLSAAENVRLPLALNGIPDAGRAEALLAAVGLGGKGRRFPGELSGGEQQRVAIARAVAHRPALLLADEPTGNLDAAAGRQALALLFGLARETGCGLLLATHDPVAAAAADRRLVLADGRLRAGDPA